MTSILLANNLHFSFNAQKFRESGSGWVSRATTVSVTNYSIWTTLTLWLNLNLIRLHILTQCSNFVSSYATSDLPFNSWCSSEARRPGHQSPRYQYQSISSDMCKRKLVLQNMMQEKTLVKLDFLWFCQNRCWWSLIGALSSTPREVYCISELLNVSVYILCVFISQAEADWHACL